MRAAGFEPCGQGCIQSEREALRGASVCTCTRIYHSLQKCGEALIVVFPRRYSGISTAKTQNVSVCLTPPLLTLSSPRKNVLELDLKLPHRKLSHPHEKIRIRNPSTYLISGYKNKLFEKFGGCCTTAIFSFFPASYSYGYV